jgi:hypothetical protein
MTEKQEIRVKAMELALKFMELVYDLPVTLEESLEETPKDDEAGIFDSIFKRAVWHSRFFEEFIQGAPTGP